MRTLPLLSILVVLSLSSEAGGQDNHPAAAPAPGPEVVPENPAGGGTAPSQRDWVPDSLRPWIDWVLRNQRDLDSPRAHDEAATRLSLWPSRLQLDATADGAKFSLEVTAFASAWLGLPGSRTAWPAAVTFNGQPVPVVERGGRPAIHLVAGKGTVTGTFQWSELPQQIKLPPEIGLLALSIDGNSQPAPSWDKDGTLWLQRQASSEPVDEDFRSLEIHSLLEDGIPLWYETRMELIVAGKSREETIGTVLPQGWLLSGIESPLPVAIDDQGLLKAQLRAGRWTIALRAFRPGSPEQIAFAEGASPAMPEQALAFRASPSFRQAEITGLPQIDVAQTQVPEEWRSLPVYRWDTTAPFQLVERVRGPGERGAAPLAIQRSLWLDDDGKALTFQDRLTGPLREIRRLDAAPGHQLGSVTVGGQPQLITHNPEGGAPGFEIRSPQLDATATGRLEVAAALPATGWQADADRLQATLHLPPGYRVFALFGADHSHGDWLTAWSLLDIFLLLLFTLAVFRLRGFLAGLLALVAFGLAYHEPGAPRLAWLLLLIPVALASGLPEGRWRNLANGLKWGAAVILLLALAPFAAQQIQGAIFPQLEKTGGPSYSSPSNGGVVHLNGGIYEQAAAAVNDVIPSSEAMPRKVSKWNSGKVSKDNLQADPKAIIQTGPGVPTWAWRRIEYGWDGPVSATQQIRPMLIPPVISRSLGLARVLCLVALAALLLTQRRKSAPAKKPAAPPMVPDAGGPTAAAALFALGLFPAAAQAQFPQHELLEELRARLTEASDAFPGAADIASARLELANETFTLTLDYHAAARTAVPVPVPLNAWVPGSATFADGGPATLLRRDGQLWALLPGSGIHQLTLSGRLLEVADWEWGFALKPRRIEVEATGWTVSGLRPDGSAEDQLLFSRARSADPEAAAAAASYDRPDTRHALMVERQIELGLVWRVRTTVSRLSPAGRAAALRVPLLPGEKVVSPGRTVEGGAIEIRLTPDAVEASWEGELSPQPQLTLATREADTWTERWRLIASPVWNVAFSDLSPTFEDLDSQLAPLWQPWPGETATLAVSRPEAVVGAAVTIDSAVHTLNPGRRQRSSTLSLSLRTSLGEDFAIALPPQADVTALTHDGAPIPVRKDGDAVVVPLRPGAQTIQVEWRLPGDGRGWTRSDAVRLPVESANVSTIISPTRDRWLLLSDGPQRGPAFRFWGVLAFALIAAFVLSRVPGSPLRLHEWLLLAIGLTQVSVVLSFLVVGWLFLIRWRGAPGYQKLSDWSYDLCQALLIILTLMALGIFISIASAGLLGNPEMYIAGNGSIASRLDWFSARSTAELPTPGYWSVSIWWYRLAMLLWALWLATALVRWLRMAWKNSSTGGHFRSKPQKLATPPAPGGAQPPQLPESR